MNRKTGELMQDAWHLYQEIRWTLKQLGLPQEGQFSLVHEALILVLEDHLSDVNLSWHKDPTKRGWNNEKAEIVVSYGANIHIPIRLSVLEEKGLLAKVKKEMKNKFTNLRAISVDGEKIWAPARSDMIPYYDLGYHGGYYWAEASATYASFEEEEHINELNALGWKEVENVSGLPLREIVKRPYDGFDGAFYWLIEKPAGYDPIETMKSQLEVLEARYSQWVSEKAVLSTIGSTVATLSDRVKAAWWTRITVEFTSGTKKSYGFNHMDEDKTGDLSFYAKGWGRNVNYRSIPKDGAENIRNDMYRALSLFDTALSEEISGFVKATAEYMGGESGLDVIHSVSATPAEALAKIESHHDLKDLKSSINTLRSYLAKQSS